MKKGRNRRMKQLFKGGTVVSGKECANLDVLVENGKVKEVAAEIEQTEDTELIDVSGKLIFPGFIDGHTHFDLEVSGTVTADDFSTGTKAAIAGGTTLILDFATQNKGETLAEALENWHRKADGKSSCDYGFHLAISDWKESICDELELVVKGGVTSFKVYMTYDAMVINDKEIYQVLKRLKELGGIVGVHCENKGIIDALVEEEKAKGNLTPITHPITRPDLAEAEAISRLLKIAAIADTPVIVVHLSSAAGYEEILRAREKGQEVYVETCPQYLLLDDSKYTMLSEESRKYVIAPPLRKKEDQSVLWDALCKNAIQTVATDHCSFTTTQKEAGKDDFTKIPCGMPGVETRPSLMYTYGVLEHGITLEQMCRFLSENPAKLYGVYPQKGCLEPGSDADLVIWDKDEIWTIGKENQVANTDYSPFEGVQVHGKAKQVYLRGELVAQDGKIVKDKLGTYVVRNKRVEIK